MCMIKFLLEIKFLQWTLSSPDFFVPHVLKDENLVDVVEASAMVASHGRGGGHNNKGGGSGRGGCLHCTYC